MESLLPATSLRADETGLHATPGSVPLTDPHPPLHPAPLQDDHSTGTVNRENFQLSYEFIPRPPNKENQMGLKTDK